MKPWLKAGLVVGILQIIFTLPSFGVFYLPAGVGGTLGLCICCLFFALYPLPGVLDAYWSPEPQSEGRVMLGGTLSGLLATGIDSVATLILIYFLSESGAYMAYFQRLMPNEVKIIDQSGMGFLFTTTGLLIQTGVGLIFHILTGVVLSSLGGLVYTGMKKKNSQ